MILPTTGDARQLGFRLLAIYLAAALGLLVTTSFLGLRRYLRQRYLPMPPSIAFAWVKFGGGVAIFVLIACMLLPRPGATVVWSQLQVKVDDQLRSVTKAVSRQKVASDSNTSEKNGRNSGNRQGDVKGGSGQSETKSGDAAPATPSNGPQLPSAQPAGQIYYLLRNSLLAIGGLLVAWWLYRSRYLLLEIWRAIVTAFHNFCYVPKFKSTRPKDEEVSFRPRRPLADFQNPFLTTAENMRPPEEVILYTYEALQAWSFEQGMQPEPEKTSREFCQQMSSRLPEIGWALQHLAYLHAHAAYGKHLPTDCNLEPLKEIWRCLTWK